MLCSSILLFAACIAQAVHAESEIEDAGNEILTTKMTSTLTKTFLATSTTTILLATDGITSAKSTSLATSASSSTSASYISDGDFQFSILAAHNFFRDEHNATALKWNATSTAFAAAYAKQCAFKHSGNPTGENLAAGYVNVTTAVNAWGLEREQYNFSAPGFSETTGHFTQIVWKSTTSVGCGRYACDGTNGTSGYYIVCEYYPPGNVQGQYSADVQKEIKGNSTLGYSMGVTGNSGYGWLIGIIAGVCANIVFVVFLVWKLS